MKFLRKLRPKFFLRPYYRQKYKQKLTPLKQLSFGMYLAEHCNLNCKHCCSFSCLSEPEFLDINKFKTQLVRVSELFNKQVAEISLLGGEPLLHPQLIDILKIPRPLFPSTSIRIITNGILLLEQNNEFWTTCRENNIIITATKYPIKLDWEKIKKIAQENSVIFRFFNDANLLKTLHKIPLDLEGKQDITISYLKCSHANACINLSDNKFFTCPTPMQIRHFNQYFSKNISVSKNDYIDIFEAESSDEILNFLCKPIPFCRYCKTRNMEINLPWGVSLKKIEEWV